MCDDLVRVVLDDYYVLAEEDYLHVRKRSPFMMSFIWPAKIATEILMFSYLRGVCILVMDRARVWLGLRKASNAMDIENRKLKSVDVRLVCFQTTCACVIAARRNFLGR